jgi:hypothetical protein
MGEGGRRGTRRKKTGLRDDDDDDDDNDGNDNSNKTFRTPYRNSLLRNRDKKCYLLSTQTGQSLRLGTTTKKELAKRKVWSGKGRVQDPATINMSPNPNLT